MIVEPITQMDDSKTTKEDFQIKKVKNPNVRDSKIAPFVQDQINKKLKSKRSKNYESGESATPHY